MPVRFPSVPNLPESLKGLSGNRPFLFFPSRNHSNLSHPSTLVIPTSGRDLQCALRLFQILPGKRPGGTISSGSERSYSQDKHLHLRF